MRVNADTAVVEYRGEDRVERGQVALPLDQADTSRPVQRRPRVRRNSIHRTHQCPHAGEPDRDSRPL